MPGRALLISVLLPVLAGCVSHSRPLGYTNTSIANSKQGQDCKTLLFGLGGIPDLTLVQAMRLGGITKLRSAEYQAKSIQGVGSECIIAYGD